MKAIGVFCVVFGAVLVAPLFPALAGQAAPAQGSNTANQDLPPGEGKDLLVSSCKGCHALTVVTAQHKTEEGWTDTIVEMRNRGANGSDEEMEKILHYLTTNFGPNSAAGGSTAAAKVNVNSASSSDMVSGLSLSQSDADAIVSYREKNGKFKDLAGLKQVPGVDAAKLDAAKDKLEF